MTRKNFLLLVTMLALLFSVPSTGGRAAASTQPDLNICRFAITAPLGTSGYPLDTLGVGGLLNWSPNNVPALPSNVEYVHVLRLRDDLYANTKANLAAWLRQYPGATWLVGNEPDTTYGNQDNLHADVYANRFYEIARQIRSLDPTAHIGFGTIVQPTAIRLRYLDLVWSKLISLAGGQSAASGLIDVWSIHSFILNEKPHEWGTGVPIDFDPDYGGDPTGYFYIPLSNIQLTYNMDLFKQRITAFRKWMYDKNQNGKPLWITEYGSLFPPIDPPGKNVYNVSDEATAGFMTKTFDYLLTATDTNTGMPADANRLVQRWFWYSLNDHRYTFGGTLFDPDDNRQATLVGQQFTGYTPPDGVTSNLQAVGIDSIYPAHLYPDGTHVDYLVAARVRTALNSNAPDAASVSLKEGGGLVSGPVNTDRMQRCGGSQTVMLLWKNVQSGTSHTLTVRVDRVDPADADSDSDPTDNEISVAVPGSALGKPKVSFLPLIYR